MDSLIVYFSRDGHTKFVAEEIQKITGSDIEQLKEDGVNRKGLWNWFLAGRDGWLGKKSKIQEIVKDPTSYEVLYIGSPVWGFNMVPAVRTNIDEIKKYIPSLTNASGGSCIFKFAI